ncbi:tetratricopeptide repeat protein [Actinoplanes hulinensis]|uniref:Tetratricopeptide repeat protein n=1 Tax=Actinoplanes hulinensis TaxID=1144547 RepID=A0ABS7B2E9_9ACTN|nr:tetratricopeptide repeat protein [Actinoplanes hulinensis]MBW6435168.1 tetratricopeptide repeat protein [Actinoplanes hulinensis]
MPTASEQAIALAGTIAARIGAYRRSGDAAAVLAPEAVEEVRRLWLATVYAALWEGGGGPAEWELLALSGWLHWCRHLAGPSPADDHAAALDHFSELLLHRQGDEIVPERARRDIDEIPRERWDGAAARVDRIGDTPELERIDFELPLLRDRLARTPDADFATHDLLTGRLRERFELSGDIRFLNEAIDLKRDVLERLPRRRRRLAHGIVLSGLGTMLTIRFGHLGELYDVDEAIEVLRRSLTALRRRDPARPTTLSALGVALRGRYDRVRNPADLDAAVDACRAATVIPGGAGTTLLGRAELLSNLGVVLQIRFEAHRRLPDLTEAIEALREAITLLPPDDPELPGYVSNLGLALCHRFDATGAAEDLDEAVRLFEAAVDGTPDGHPDRVMYLSNLSGTLQSRHALSNRPLDGRRARDTAYEGVAVRSSPVAERVKAAHHWGRSAAAMADWADAADGFAAAVDLLPLLAWRGLNRTSRELLLLDWRHLTDNAAACACAAGDPARALCLLEVGRAVLWTQQLDTRTDLTAVRAADPALADRLLTVANGMEAPGLAVGTGLSG